jgi:hypothetical protein
VVDQSQVHGEYVPSILVYKIFRKQDELDLRARHKKYQKLQLKQ